MLAIGIGHRIHYCSFAPSSSNHHPLYQGTRRPLSNIDINVWGEDEIDRPKAAITGNNWIHRGGVATLILSRDRTHWAVTLKMNVSFITVTINYIIIMACIVNN